MSQRRLHQLLRERGSTTDLLRVLSGRLELKLRHLLDIAQALDLYPLEFFRMVFDAPPTPSPLLRRLQALIPHHAAVHGPALDAPSPLARQLDEIQQRLGELARDVEQLKAAARNGARSTENAAGRGRHHIT
jgi:hypothetical protein